MALRALVIDAKDNVANLIVPGRKGEQVQCVIEGSEQETTVTLLDELPSNHKFAFSDIKSGAPILKYGLDIGRATRDIRQGEHVHAHNIESNRGRGDLAKEP
jgi:altronate dehydratase small subunit